MLTQEDAAPADEPQGIASEEEASEDDANMDDEEGGDEQHTRMLEDVRAAGRPASSRRPKHIQTESVPESGLNVGPMTGTDSCPPAACTLTYWMTSSQANKGSGQCSDVREHHAKG